MDGNSRRAILGLPLAGVGWGPRVSVRRDQPAVSLGLGSADRATFWYYKQPEGFADRATFWYYKQPEGSDFRVFSLSILDRIYWVQPGGAENRAGVANWLLR